MAIQSIVAHNGAQEPILNKAEAAHFIAPLKAYWASRESLGTINVYKDHLKTQKILDSWENLQHIFVEGLTRLEA